MYYLGCDIDDFVEIQYKEFRFVITKTPTDKALQMYIKELKKHNVGVVIRTCKPSYDTKPLLEAGIEIYDLTIQDGATPTNEMLKIFFNIVKSQFLNNPESGVAIHCVAGLGRAPLLVAIALIELGYTYEDAIHLIRARRRGAINAKQLDYLSRYKSKSRLQNKKEACIIM